MIKIPVEGLRVQIRIVCSILICLAVHAASGQEVSLGLGVSMKGRALAPFEAWIPMSFAVENEGETDAEVLVTSYFAERPDQNFSRRVWIPAHSARQVEYRVFTPPSNVEFGKPEAKDLRTLLLVKKDGVETAVLFSGGERFDSRFIRCADYASRIVLIKDENSDDPHLLLDAFLDREAIHMGVYQVESLPQQVADYSAIDHVVIASNRITENRMALNALRQWVVSGGVLWIMLDRVDPAIVDEFVSDATIVPIETVDLSTVEIRQGSGNHLSGDFEPVDYETSIQMVNVAATGFKELATVNGWPAVLEAKAGRGKVLVTTLNSEAWRYTPLLQKERPGEQRGLTDTGLTVAGESLKGYFLTSLSMPDSEDVDLTEITTDQIGYEIPSRGLVTLILGSFCVLLPILTLMQSRRTELLKMTWIAPVIAVLCTGTLVAMGNNSRLAIEPSEITTQIVELDATGNSLVKAARATYRQSAGTSEIVFPAEGLEHYTPQLPGSAKRMVITDDGAIHWENLEFPAGEQSSVYEAQHRFAPTVAVMRVEESGLHGQLVGERIEPLSDGLITFPSGRSVSLQVSDDGTLKSGLNATLPSGQFLSDQVLGDQQRRRMQIYREYLNGSRLIPEEPRLYIWTDPIDPEITDVDEPLKRGDALLSVPLEIKRPETGTRFRVAPAMIDYRAVVHPIWGSSTVFRNNNKTWTDSVSQDSYSLLRCSLPKEIGQVAAQSVEMLMDLKIANRVLEVIVVRPNGEEEIVKTLESPVGEYTVTFSEAEDFSHDPEEFLTVMLHVGPASVETDAEGENALGWQIKDVIFQGEFVAE